MNFDELVKQNKNNTDLLLQMQYKVSHEHIYLLSRIINNLYKEKKCIDIKLIVDIIEANNGSLFSSPRLVFKLSKLPDYWYKKDLFGIDKIYIDNLQSLANDTLPLTSSLNNDYNKDKQLQELLLLSTEIINNYKWDHFVNIGSIKKSHLWSNKKSLSQQHTTEDTWFADLSEINFIETLAMISCNVSYNEIKNYLIKVNAEELNEKLSKKESVQIKNKI